MAEKNISVSEIRDDVTNNFSNTRKNSDITNFARTILGQGTLLGFGDELESFARSLFDKRGYGEILDEVQGELKQFKKDRPIASTVAELGGSLLTGAAGVGRTVAKTALKSGALGGIYGAGTTDDTSSDSISEAGQKRIQNAVNSAIFSAGIGAAGKKFFGASKDAKKLLDKGVELSPGQTIDGFVGNNLKKIEESLTSVPFLGTSGMLENVRKTFNIAVANEIGSPVGVKITKDVPLNEIRKVLSLKIKSKIDDAAKKLSINKPDEFLDEIVVGLQNSGANKNIIKKEIKQFNDFFMRSLKFETDDMLKGSNVQALDEHINGIVKNYKNSQNSDLLIIGDIFKDAQSQLANILKKDSGADAYSYYKKTKNAFKNLKIFNQATLSSKTKEGLTPAQLLSSSISNDPTAGKMGSVLGKGQLQDIAETGQRIIGSTVPDSGTTTRGLIATGILGGGSAMINPLIAGGGAAGLLSYKVPALRNSLIGGRGIIASSPFFGSGLGERFGLK